MSQGSSSKAMTLVLVGNGLVVPALKFKHSKVSVNWDFPPGCGRVAAPSSRSSSDAQEFLALYVIRCVIIYYV
ncbi:hypothetical protein J1N35_037555 [Gossypium stocksii]|uniref:Uncharacterized protein n=1 Tax=Gossypium stocksii TaxID=47602 RepID=A0A9D3ZL14_9ROSI|nr:hypothetical protein J1N35_037555 [Gossypium stocksii]